MSKFDICVRKKIDSTNRLYWLEISAKVVETENGMVKRQKSRSYQKTKFQKLTSCNFVEEPSWTIFLLGTIVVNLIITINSLPYSVVPGFIYYAVIVHITCLVYWIDFFVAFFYKIIQKKLKEIKTRKTQYMIIDAISLIPLSIMYLLLVHQPNITIFWYLRLITLLRLYRIPVYISTISTAGRNHWKILAVSYIFYLCVFIDMFASIWLVNTKNRSYDISDWNKTALNQFIVSLYFSEVTVLNIGFGDIVPDGPRETIICCIGITFGYCITAGVLTGALTTQMAIKEKRREMFRSVYESTINSMKHSKVDKMVIEKVSDNLISFWMYKEGLLEPPEMSILPFSLQKEIYFDINFGFLNRSPIFSLQSRAFLRR